MAKARHRLKARIRRRYTYEKLAQHLNLGTSTVRDWVQGVSVPNPDNWEALAEALNVTDAELAILFEDYDHAVNGHKVPNWLGHLASLEQGATEIFTFESFVIPGLLQTREYAEAVERADPVARTDDEIAQRVELRITRQRVLRSLRRFSVVLDESVLYRVAGDSQVMAGQLEHLAEVAERDNVYLRILPLDAGGFAAGFGAFIVLTSADSDKPYMVVISDRSGPHYLDRLPEIEAHTALFAHLTEMALPLEESIELIRRVRKERYQ